MKQKKKRHKKINCPECRKKNPHTHKGCNEDGLSVRTYDWID